MGIKTWLFVSRCPFSRLYLFCLAMAEQLTADLDQITLHTDKKPTATPTSTSKSAAKKPRQPTYDKDAFKERLKLLGHDPEQSKSERMSNTPPPKRAVVTHRLSDQVSWIASSMPVRRR